jgi:Asp-tRNA(Asn)/Glu-tRNA(Gln) amidotransferase C subunit
MQVAATVANLTLAWSQLHRAPRGNFLDNVPFVHTLMRLSHYTAGHFDKTRERVQEAREFRVRGSTRKSLSWLEIRAEDFVKVMNDIKDLLENVEENSGSIIKPDQTVPPVEGIPFFLDLVCKNWLIECVHDCFIAPLEAPKDALSEDLKYVKILAILSKLTKGDFKAVQTELHRVLSFRKHILRKVNEDVDADVLWAVKESVERKRTDGKLKKICSWRRKRRLREKRQNG